VHHVTHPQLPGALEGEAAAIGVAGRVGARLHQAVADQQAMDGGGRQRECLGHLAPLAGLLDHQAHRQAQVGFLD
jgi:hypothetical protein